MSESDETLEELQGSLDQKAGERCALERVVDHLEKRAGQLFVRDDCNGDLAQEVRDIVREIRIWAERASQEQSKILANIKSEQANNSKAKR